MTPLAQRRKQVPGAGAHPNGVYTLERTYIVTPYAPGPAAEALERRGPGPFQALYRTASMGAAARWMQEDGMPPLARGVRNTGEQAMLAPPGEACGAYIGFVGPA